MNNHDEDEELEKAQQEATHWRNAFWAEMRAHQAAEEARENARSFSSGEYRGIRQPRPGAQSVRPEDTTGSYAYCWCGKPADHDWPGKSRGRRHPKISERPTEEEEPMPTDTEAPRIERKHLKTYHEDLVDVILRAVNDYGVRYRLSHNSCLLYPPDGTAPFTIYARNSDRQARQARKWFIEHVVVTDGATALVKDADVLERDMDMREKTRQLAEKLNGPEHEPETASERKTRKRRERTEAAEQMTTAAEARPPAPPRPAGNWRTFVNGKGVENPHFEINDDGTIRCVECGWATKVAKAIGGHWMTHHSPEHRAKLWSRESREKANATRDATVAEKNAEAARARIEHGLTLIAEATGVTLATDTSGLETQVAELQELLVIAEQERDEANKAREEAIADRDKAQGRLNLLREALGS